jgi:3-dehydroquinate dehydratase-2
MKLLILNGPNLNRLGVRETHIYGTKSYEELVKMSKLWAQEHGFEADVRQSNHEGILIDLVQCVEMMGYHALLINPGAYAHYSYALADALRSVSVPKVEVHLSDIMNRENFRKISVTASACDKLIIGCGFDGYRQAILCLAKMVREP